MNEENGNQTKRDLSFTKLTALIIGSTIGGGIFTTAGDMASAGAHTGSVLIGWLICGVGMIGLMMSFFGLNKVKPELTNGIYSYAKEGFGEYIGFNSAWGYWISALLCNVSYTTLLFGALGYFFPIFGEGNNLIAIVCASVLIWLVNALVLSGVKEAAALNIITTIGKLVPVFVFIIGIIFVGAFKPSVFMENFWGNGDMSVLEQVKATTSSTVWSFIGVEGAVVLSARAKKSSDVGKASMTGFLGIFVIYLMVAILSMGLMPTEQMAELGNPQMAELLQVAIGPVGAIIVNVGLIISLAGALLGWTILAADCPYSAAQQGVFMEKFAKSNKNGSPAFSLLLTNGIVQLFIIILYFNDSTYQVFYGMSVSMIMVPYLLSALYYEQVTRRKEGLENLSSGAYMRERIFAIVGSIYGLWMLYSGGLQNLLITTILYAPGLIVFALGKKEKGKPLFDNKFEVGLAVVLVVLGAMSLTMIFTGQINPF